MSNPEMFSDDGMFVLLCIDAGGGKCTQYNWHHTNHVWIGILHFAGTLSGEAFLLWLSDDQRSFCL